LPQATDLPDISSAATGFGCLYVLEGATLGSQIIKRLLLQHLAISSENGGAFFNAYGDRVGDMWQVFRETVSQFSVAHPQTDDAIIKSAQETFVKLDAWFMRRLG
jgi:heme oxygenase